MSDDAHQLSQAAEVTLQDSGVGDPRAQALGHAFLSASRESMFDWETLLHDNSPWVPGSRVSKDSPFKREPGGIFSPERGQHEGQSFWS